MAIVEFAKSVHLWCKVHIFWEDHKILLIPLEKTATFQTIILSEFYYEVTDDYRNLRESFNSFDQNSSHKGCQFRLRHTWKYPANKILTFSWNWANLWFILIETRSKAKNVFRYSVIWSWDKSSQIWNSNCPAMLILIERCVEGQNFVLLLYNGVTERN